MPVVDASPPYPCGSATDNYWFILTIPLLKLSVIRPQAVLIANSHRPTRGNSSTRRSSWVTAGGVKLLYSSV